jgi:hypothetical protein
MLGGYQMADGGGDGARQSFDRSAEYAELAEVMSEKLLAQAFSILAEAMTEDEPGGLKNRLESVKAALLEEEYGADFVHQVETAQRVFDIQI